MLQSFIVFRFCISVQTSCRQASACICKTKQNYLIKTNKRTQMEAVALQPTAGSAVAQPPVENHDPKDLWDGRK